MPIYEYQCEECGHRTEALQRVGADPLQECPECSGPLRKLISAPAFQFKGSGWYVTDYAGKKGGGSESGGDGEGSAKDSGGDSGGDSAGGSSKGKAGEGGGDGKAAAKTATKSSD